MTVLRGELGEAFYGPKKTVTIILPTPREELLATPEDLPTVEPATSQVVYTIQPSDLPVLPPGATCVYTAFLYAAGKNAGASSATVYYRVLKNGTSVATGSFSVSAGYFYTLSAYKFFDVKPGDILECRLWASAAGVNWDYKALAVSPTRVKAWKDKQVLVDVGYSSLVYFPHLVRGKPLRSSLDAYLYHFDRIMALFPSTMSGEVYCPGPNYSFCCISYGDYNAGCEVKTSSSSRPYYLSNRFFTSLTFRPTPIIVP